MYVGARLELLQVGGRSRAAEAAKRVSNTCLSVRCDPTEPCHDGRNERELLILFHLNGFGGTDRHLVTL
jgi:hypothetical protein